MADRTVSVALQLKIAGYTSSLRTAQQKTRKFGDELAAQARKNKDGYDEVGRGAAAIGVAGLAGLGLAAKKYADFDKAISNVKASTHETAGNMALLRDAALEAGARTAFSATEAAGAIENLAKAGVATRDILNGGLDGALALAAAGELEVADAAEVAATALTQFKLEGEDVPHVADLLAAGAGKAQGEVSDLAAALNQGGLVASQMGLSIEETVGTLASFAAAGLVGSDAGTSFKTMLLALANPSEKASGAMKDLGIQVYDAQGAFIGAAPLAEQLKTKLGGLSEEQRNSALATIFGSDAIRAANVLYSNGAAGISDWTTKVNDAGFAAETAAIKQDNLRGDLEKLGGSFETALIKFGEGGNGPLRGLTQNLTAVVDKFGELPDPVKQGGVALAGIAGAGGLAAAGALKAATAAGEAKEAWQNLGKTGRGLTLSMGAVGVALTAAVFLYGEFTKKNAEAKQEAESLRSTLDEQTGAITGNTRAYVANDLAQSGLAQKAKDLGLGIKTVTDAALGNQSALDEVTSALDEVIAAGTTYRTDLRTGVTSTFYTEDAEAARQLRTEIVGTSSALSEAKKQQILAAEGAKEHKSAQDLTREAIAKANVKIKEQAADLEDVIDGMHRASGAALSLSGAQISYQAALDDATKGLKDNGRSLDINTEKGRANRANLDRIAEAANSQTDAMLRSGYSNQFVRKTSEEARRKFVEAAGQMRINKTDAQKLAKSLIDIPAKVATAVSNSAPAAKKNVDTYRETLRLTPVAKETRFQTAGIATARREVTGFGQHVDKTLAGIKNESASFAVTFSKNAPGGRTPKFAGGGPVFGAGTATSDSIPALLSNNEHVWTAEEVQAAGGHGAVKEMRRAALGYARGGPVLTLNTDAPTLEQIRATTTPVASAIGKALAEARRSAALEAGPGGPRQNFRGKSLNARTIAMLQRAEADLGRTFRITQGSYSTSVAASGSTHSGGGAMDTNGPGGWSAAQTALRRAGFAAWHRTPSQGPWGHHIHSIAIGDSSASASAKRQVQDYLRGGDGLAGGARKTTTSSSRAVGGRTANFADGGPVKPLSYDDGGMLPTGPSFVYNGTGRPEPVGHDVMRRSDFAGMLAAMTITNWKDGTGHIQLLARGEVAGEGRFQDTMTRMGAR